MNEIFMFNIEVDEAVHALENVNNRLHQQGTNIYDEEIMRLKHVLSSPLLHQLLAIQVSCAELNDIIARTKGDTINDFEFSQDGKIIPIPSKQLKVQKGNRHVEKRMSLNNLKRENRELFESLNSAAQGRDMKKIVLSKPETGGLGFTVVGLKSQNKGNLGIFIQDVQKDGIAAK